MDYKCNYTNPVNFTLLSLNFTNTYSEDLIPQTASTSKDLLGDKLLDQIIFNDDFNFWI